MRGGAALRVVLDLEGRRDGSAGRPHRRGVVGRGAQRQPHQRRRSPRRGSPTAAAAAGALAGPRPGHLPFLACLSPGVVVRPATIVVNKSPIDWRRARAADLGRGAARHRPGRARRRRRRRADRPGEVGRDRRARRRSGSIPTPTTRPRSSGRTARPCAARSPTRCNRRPRPTPCEALVARREEAANVYYTRRLACGSPRSRSGATACSSTRRSTPRGIPCRARGSRRRW